MRIRKCRKLQRLLYLRGDLMEIRTDRFTQALRYFRSDATGRKIGNKFLAHVYISLYHSERLMRLL